MEILKMNKVQLLQDPFLNALRREHVPVSLYLVNGIKLQGQIESFDQYVVLLKNTVTQMVYKHAISTVVPARPISLQQEQKPSQPEWRKSQTRIFPRPTWNFFNIDRGKSVFGMRFFGASGF